MGNDVSVTVTERKVDEKRRVTLPSTVSLKGGAKIVLIASRDAAIIASDKKLAEKLADVLRELETGRKLLALAEWEKMIDEAGLSGLTSESIDRAVARGIPRPRGLHVNKEARTSD